jgi:hypothetical protein
VSFGFLKLGRELGLGFGRRGSWLFSIFKQAIAQKTIEAAYQFATTIYKLV